MKEMGCQIVQKGDMRHPQCDSPSLGGRRLRGLFFCLEWSARTQRRYTTTMLIVDAYYVLQEMVGVLSDPKWGAAMFASGHTSRRVAL